MLVARYQMQDEGKDALLKISANLCVLCVSAFRRVYFNAETLRAQSGAEDGAASGRPFPRRFRGWTQMVRAGRADVIITRLPISGERRKPMFSIQTFLGGGI